VNGTAIPIGVEGHSVLTENGENRLLGISMYQVVPPLINSWLDIAPFVADVQEV
jgi:hypothetical protein